MREKKSKGKVDDYARGRRAEETKSEMNKR